jgi:uncharacterized protein
VGPTSSSQGDATARDEIQRRAPELFTIADGGDADAQALAGGLLLEFLRRPVDARRYFELAAKQGNPAGRRGFGLMLMTGNGGDRDAGRAVEEWTAATEDGDAHAAFNLAMSYRSGQGVETDEARARELFQRAAELGLGAGGLVLGNALAKDGRHEEARYWHLRGAEGGSAPAMYALAEACRDGVGGPVDRVQAVRWYLKMIDHGDTRGAQEAVAVSASMTPEEIQEAARQAGREEDAEPLIRRSRS